MQNGMIHMHVDEIYDILRLYAFDLALPYMLPFSCYPMSVATSITLQLPAARRPPRPTSRS
jgi:hypothetical protein